MNKFSKKSVIGLASVVAATALVAGMAAPAMADTTGSATPAKSSSTITNTQLASLRELPAQLAHLPALSVSASVNVGSAGTTVSTSTPPSTGVTATNPLGSLTTGNPLGSLTTGSPLSSVGTDVNNLVGGLLGQ